MNIALIAEERGVKYVGNRINSIINLFKTHGKQFDFIQTRKNRKRLLCESSDSKISRVI
jgi:hypothetical protein